MLLSDFSAGVKYGMIEGENICDHTNTYRLTWRWQAMYHYFAHFLNERMTQTSRFRKAAFGLGFRFGRSVRDRRPRFKHIEMGGRTWIRAS